MLHLAYARFRRACFHFRFVLLIAKRSMVGMRGLEPRTSSLSEKRSNQLSYTPVVGTDFVCFLLRQAQDFAYFVMPPLVHTEVIMLASRHFLATLVSDYSHSAAPCSQGLEIGIFRGSPKGSKRAGESYEKIFSCQSKKYFLISLFCYTSS